MMAAESGLPPTRSPPTAAISRPMRRPWSVQAPTSRPAGPDDIRAIWRHWRLGHGARSSAARKLSAIRQFHRFLHGDGLARRQSGHRHRESARRAALAEDDLRGRGVAAHRHGTARGLQRRRARPLAQGVAAAVPAGSCSMPPGLRVSELVGLTVQAVNPPSAISSWSRARAGASGWCRLSAAARQAARAIIWSVMAKRAGRYFEVAVSVLRSRWPSDAAALRAGTEGAAARAGIAPARISPHVLRHGFATPPARPWCRSSRRAADAGPCGHFHNTDLYPCAVRNGCARWWRATTRLTKKKLTSARCGRPVSAQPRRLRPNADISRF